MTARHISTFPWPFPQDKDSFQFTTNMIGAGTIAPTAAGQWGENVIWIEPDEYRTYIAERNAIIDLQPYEVAALPSAAHAVWDTALFLMERMSLEHPAYFRLHSDGDEMVWENDLLDIRQRFTYGDDSTLPGGPLEYIGRQTTDDLLILREHDGQLWLDAGVLLTWSIRFTLGMSFDQLHHRTVGFVPPGVVERAQRFLMRLEPGEVTRRDSWIFNVGSRVTYVLDPAVAAKLFPPAPAMPEPDDLDEIGRRIHFRSEPQHLVRLPRTGHILYMINARLLSLEDLVSVPAWARQLLTILETLDPIVYKAKGLPGFNGAIENYLRHSLSVGAGITGAPSSENRKESQP
jgi:hypothetical protein